MDITKESPTVVSFCSGYGGIELGLSRVFGELTQLAHVEIEAFAIANLVAKMEAGLMVPAPVWTDVKTFPSEVFRGSVDILTGGYPCQPFSAAGKRLGAEDPRHLWPHIRKAIGIIQPRYCFFENVEGHISLGLSTVISDLEEDGYRTAWGIFSAAEVGAPHQRKRVFILGYRDSLNRSAPTEGRIDGGQAGSAGEELGYSKHNGSLTSKNRGSISEKQKERWMQEPERRCGQELAYSSSIRGEARFSEPTQRQEGFSGIALNDSCLRLWPSRPGEPQHEWEPPRVVHTGHERQTVCEQQTTGSEQSNSNVVATKHRKTQSPLGRDTHGSTDRVDYAELYESCDNRTDELRLLGNGVVPATAAKAFATLIGRY